MKIFSITEGFFVLGIFHNLLYLQFIITYHTLILQGKIHIIFFQKSFHHISYLTLEWVHPGVHLFQRVHNLLISKYSIMTTFKLHIRFNLVMSRTNNKGFSSVKCRLTYNKNRKDFSTGITVNPNYWDPKKQRLLDQSDQEEIINMQISLIENKISKAFLMLQVKDEPFSVQDIYNAFNGNTLKQELGILEVWNLHNERNFYTQAT